MSKQDSDEQIAQPESGKPSSDVKHQGPFNGLTGKQARFVEEYLKDFNATQAAIRSGHGNTYGSSAVAGHDLLKNPNVSKVIKLRLSELHMTAEELLRILATQARGLPPECFNKDGTIKFSQLKKLGLTGLVTESTQTRSGVKLKLASHDKALEMLAKHKGLLSETVRNINIDIGDLTNEQLERIAAGEDPIAVAASGPSSSDTGTETT